MTFQSTYTIPGTAAVFIAAVFMVWCWSPVAAQSTAQDHLTYQPADVDWQPGPPSLENGAEFAVLEGNPGEEGIFTLRIKMPDGFQIAPHWHPEVERVSVLSGTFLLGPGEVADRAAADSFEPGSYLAMPPEMRHFAMAEGETVIQLTSMGPWEINYINSDDDPRLRD